MKSLLLSLILFCSLLSSAQNAIPTPEYSNRVYVVKSNTLADLERSDASLVTNMMSGLMSWSIPKLRAAYRISGAQVPVMVVKIEGGGDPAEMIALYKADIKKDERIISTGKKLSGKPKDTSASQVALTFKKIGDGIYEISFSKSLAPGEYIFLPVTEANKISALNPSKIKMSCFGVD